MGGEENDIRNSQITATYEITRANLDRLVEIEEMRLALGAKSYGSLENLFNFLIEKEFGLWEEITLKRKAFLKNSLPNEIHTLSQSIDPVFNEDEYDRVKALELEVAPVVIIKKHQQKEGL